MRDVLGDQVRMFQVELMSGTCRRITSEQTQLSKGKQLKVNIALRKVVFRIGEY